ncbi:docking protein 2 isoform X2 [Xenopus laevis]|uniref:Docking protein 2 isoform X2 n=1 Tax=Xenopus laevis TaxID=8355 RepID=A0A8J0UUS2_XENLA|nr:docking protein 2 isoform X2 [Xenopus laevis]
MDGGIVKQGALYLQHQQRFGKKWKKVWAMLYEATCSGLARLEMFEGSQPPDSGRKPECWKLLQLSECVSVSERNGEGSPKDTRSFSIETAQRVYLLASETSEQPGWVKALCSLAFPQDRLPLERKTSQPAQSDLHLQENELYSTKRETVFVVRIRPTEASIRCGLNGMYTLSAENSCLFLRDRQTGSSLYNWPYPYLRRFGRDKSMFSFEAGRRCNSGEGSFEFETPLGGQIFQAIECAINTRSGKQQVIEEQPLSSRKRTTSLLPKGPAVPVPCPQSDVIGKPSIKEESEYAVPFDKVAQKLLATGFGGLLGPQVPAQGKLPKTHQAEPIYDEPGTPQNPVYDEPEVIRSEAWKTQATDAHETGYEYPYLPGWDDYAVPRGSGADGEQQGEAEEWGEKGERAYDNITLKGGNEN